MRFIAINLTKLPTTCLVALPAAMLWEPRWACTGPKRMPLCSFNWWDPCLAGRALWTAGEPSQTSPANSGTLQWRTLGRGTQPSWHHPTRLSIKINTPLERQFRRGSGTPPLGPPRGPRRLMQPGLQFRLIKTSVSRSGGPHTGIYESSPDGSNAQPREKLHRRIF